ncbi:MAG: response regulator [Chitinispirillales bacterium]|jgi:PAS domain S-box-containing protein|nr:response regulator [Chitinispirillales bacterium]
MYEARKNSVLIVDDENSNILALMHILNPNYTVYAAKNGVQALKAVEKYSPDIILLDIVMPEMDGYAVLETLKASEATKNIPVIFITGLSDTAAEERGFALGIADYITKPFSTTIVKLRLRNQIQLIEQFRSNEYDIMKYKLANDALGIALWDMDVVSDDPVNFNNKFTWSNEIRQMLGVSEAEFPNLLHSWSNRLHPDDKEKTLNAFAAHLNDQTGETPYNVEYRLKLKSGEYRHFQALGTTLRDNNGVATRTAGAIRDITKEKEMKRKVAEAMAKNEADAHWYKSILNAIPLPISVTDADMNWKFVNRATEKLLQTKREDMLGKPCRSCNLDVCGTDDCGVVSAKRGQKRAFFSHNGFSYQNDIEILHNIKGDIAGFIEVAQDITNIQLLAKQRAEAEMTNRAKSAFLANMSHEIRTPMNAILGVTEILMHSESLPAEIDEGLGKIYASCNMLLGIINDILDFSKIEAGKLDILPAEYKVASLINDSAHLNIMKIEDKTIEFELQIDENLPAQLIGDELRIKQILNNLLSNAFKYTDTGKVTLSTTFKPSNTGVTLVLSVRDTGNGMTKEQVEKLFDEYSRFNNRTIEGTGLGLSITQRLVNLMNGEIHVESEPGTGSLFVVQLPQATVDSEVLGAELVANLQQFRTHEKKKLRLVREPMPYGNVLIVDDVETNLYVAEGLMKPYKLQIETVNGGYAAIKKITAGNVYDIVFMDHMMPGMDGMETTRRLRETGYTAPIVALTANAVAGQADIFLQNGFDAFISKPIDIRQLHSILHKYIRDKQPPEVLEAARELMSNAEADDSDGTRADKRLLESFIRDARKAVELIEKLCENGEIETEEGARDFTTAVHGMKSSLANIGEKELSARAYDLEQAGRERDTGQIAAPASGFLKELRALVEKLESKLQQDENGGEGGEIEDLREKVLAVKELCGDYNRKGALDMLAEIKGGSKETRAALDAIKELVLQSEFDEAESAAAAYAEKLPLDGGENKTYGEALTWMLNKKIPGFDVLKGLERYHNDEEMYLKIMHSYADSVRSMLGSIETFSEENVRDYEIIVHGIKGACFDIFVNELGESAKALEFAAKADDFNYITAHNPPFIEAMDKFISELEAVLSAIDAENPKPKKDKPDGEILAKLLTACKDYDMDGADNAMAEIEEYQYTSDDGLAVLLRDCVNVMDFQKIIEKLSEPDI